MKVFSKEIDIKIDYATEVNFNKASDKAYKLFIKAELFRKSKAFQLSIAEYLKSLFLCKDNYKVFLGLGISYKNVHNYEKALKYLTKAHEMCPTPDNFLIFANLGMTLLYLERPEDALPNLQKAIMINKEDLDIQLHLAMAHEIMTEYEMALAIYQKIIELEPSFLPAYNRKAALLMLLERYQDAATFFNDILKINPDFYRAYLGIGLCFDKIGREQDAIRYYKKYIAIKPNSIYARRSLKRIEEIITSKKQSKTPVTYLSLVN